MMKPTKHIFQLITRKRIRDWVAINIASLIRSDESIHTLSANALRTTMYVCVCLYERDSRCLGKIQRIHWLRQTFQPYLLAHKRILFFFTIFFIISNLFIAFRLSCVGFFRVSLFPSSSRAFAELHLARCVRMEARKRFLLWEKKRTRERVVCVCNS